MDSSEPAEPHEVRAPLAAPPVEVVIVAHEPGDWFTETLASVASQDYVDYKVTVLVSGDTEAVGAVITGVVKDATVISVEPHFGYARAVNQILEADEHPAFYLFCHDDVSLAPDALRLLVEEALRSNASVAGPKLVAWDNPAQLLDVGLDVDKLGYSAPRVEPGELDQEQHDAVTDVFAIPGAVQLVRASLFTALEGYDAEMGVTGEDIDFCWRAHVAGARVMLVPPAVARHRQGLGERKPNKAIETMSERHRVRTLLSVYGVMHTLRVVPQGIIYAMLRALGSLATGQFSRASAALGAWSWNLRRPASLMRRRRLLKSVRKVPDREIRGLQVGGFAPVNTFLRGTFTEEGGGSIGARARNVITSLRSGPSRISLGFWVATAAVLAFGSRHLITRRVPVVGDLVPFDQGPGQLFGAFFDNWWATGTGHEAPAPTAYGILGSLGVLFFGAMGLLRTVLTVGLVPLGAVGLWRLLRPFSSPWIRVVGTMVYLASPVPYNALAQGVWSSLLLYAGLPWLLAGLARGARIAPFGRVGGAVGEGVLEPSWQREVLALGIPLGVLFAFEPFVLVIVVGMALAVAVGTVLAGWPGGAPRMAAVLAGATVVALALNAPWVIGAVSGANVSWDWFLGTRPERPDAFGLAQLMRFDTGPLGGAPLGWALPVAGLVPLLLARGPRWAWAVRGQVMYLAAVGAVWAASEGWVPVSMPRPEIILVAGALGLSIATAMGVAAIERDLRTYRFGWRQLAPITAVAAVLLGMIPATGAALTGDWDMPGTDFNTQFGQGGEPDAPQRVLWIGHDDVLGAGGQVFGDDGLTLAVTASVKIGLEDRWAATTEPGDRLIAEAVELALDGGTSRLGRLLSPFGIGEVIVVERAAPAPASATAVPVDPAVLAALTEQLDLAEVELGDGVTRYRNTSVLPIVTVTDSGQTAGVALREYAATPGLSTVDYLSPQNQRRTEFLGSADTTQEVYVAVPAGSSWRLQVGDRFAAKSRALDWALAYQPISSGDALLTHDVPASHRILMGAHLGLWLLAIGALLRLSSRSRAEI